MGRGEPCADNTFMQSSAPLSAPPSGIQYWLLRLPAAGLIAGYQRFLSPLKGYRCAHRVLHGGDSCSQYVKQTLLAHTANDAWRLARQRFAACARAQLILMNEAQRPERPEEGERRGVGKDAGQKCFLLPTSMCCLSGFALK